MDGACESAVLRSMSVPLDVSHCSLNSSTAGASSLSVNIEERVEQIRSILKPLYYAEASDFDTAETRALTKRLVVLSKLRSLNSDDERNRCGNAFCAADLPAVFQRIWSVVDQLGVTNGGNSNSDSFQSTNSNRVNAIRSSVLEDDSRAFSLVYRDLITCLWNVTDVSAELCRLFYERGCIEIFVNDLRTPLFLEKGMNDDLKSTVGYATRGYFGILRNLVRGEPNCVARFVELGGIEMSVPYLDTPFQLLKMKVIMLLSDVVTDERDETRSAIVGSRSNLEYVAKVVADACTSGSELDGFYSRKYAYCVDELLGAVAKLATSNDRNVQTFLDTDLLDTLEHLLTRLRAVLLEFAAKSNNNNNINNNATNNCSNAEMSHLLSQQLSISSDRTKIINTSCEVLRAAFSCIWAFAFNDSAKDAILKRRSLVDVLRSCTPQPKVIRTAAAAAGNVHHLLDSRVHNEAAGALWQLQRCSSTHCMTEGRVSHEHNAVQDEPLAAGHVMITYQHSSQDLVRPLYEALVRIGLRVWIDYAEMHGSTVEAMALAVERADVLLVCVSHAYKQSPSCRAEAMYAYRLKKPFIPIRVQASYVPDGWLGFICGSELLLELSKPTYLDGTFQRLTRILCQRGFSQGLGLSADAGQTTTRYVSSHVHTHSQPNSDAASYFTQHSTNLCSTDSPRNAAQTSDGVLEPVDKMASHIPSLSLSQLPISSDRAPSMQHQVSTPSSIGSSSHLRVLQPRAIANNTIKQPAHIDHVFVPPESPAVSGRGTISYGMSNATSSYSVAETAAGSSTTGFTNYARSSNSNAQANEMTYELLSGSGRDAKHSDYSFDYVKPPNVVACDESEANVRCGSVSVAGSAVHAAVDLCELVSWSCENVAAWLETQGVNEGSRVQMREIDGALLYELAAMQKEAPQFLYETLRSDFRLPLVSLLRVVRALRKLNSPSNLLNHY